MVGQSLGNAGQEQKKAGKCLWTGLGLHSLQSMFVNSQPAHWFAAATTCCHHWRQISSRWPPPRPCSTTSFPIGLSGTTRCRVIGRSRRERAGTDFCVMPSHPAFGCASIVGSHWAVYALLPAADRQTGGAAGRPGWRSRRQAAVVWGQHGQNPALPGKFTMMASFHVDTCAKTYNSRVVPCAIASSDGQSFLCVT